MDETTFWYLISLVAQEDMSLHIIDVVTTYLYGSLENDIYIKLPEPKGFNLPNKVDSKEDYSIKLNKSLYGLKQSECIWYNCLSE